VLFVLFSQRLVEYKFLPRFQIGQGGLEVEKTGFQGYAT